MAWNEIGSQKGPSCILYLKWHAKPRPDLLRDDRCRFEQHLKPFGLVVQCLVRTRGELHAYDLGHPSEAVPVQCLEYVLPTDCLTLPNRVFVVGLRILQHRRSVHDSPRTNNG